jgi:hypothetical protein
MLDDATAVFAAYLERADTAGRVRPLLLQIIGTTL